jgi:hypothetical protein
MRRIAPFASVIAPRRSMTGAPVTEGRGARCRARRRARRTVRCGRERMEAPRSCGSEPCGAPPGASMQRTPPRSRAGREEWGGRVLRSTASPCGRGRKPSALRTRRAPLDPTAVTIVRRTPRPGRTPRRGVSGGSGDARACARARAVAPSGEQVASRWHADPDDLRHARGRWWSVKASRIPAGRTAKNP